MPYRSRYAQNEASKANYRRNKSLYVKRAKEHTRRRRAESRAIVQNWKKERQCVVCGFDDWRALQTHHKPEFEKVGNIADMARDGWSVNKVRRELAKCEAICANCHQIHHHEERESGDSAWHRQADSAAEPEPKPQLDLFGES